MIYCELLACIVFEKNSAVSNNTPVTYIVEYNGFDLISGRYQWKWDKFVLPMNWEFM